MANFHISVINKVATNNEPDKTLVCGNGDHTLVFAFDSEWDADPAKTARFIYYRDGVLKYQDVVFTGNLVQAPMLSDISEVFVGVYTGNLRTTTPARIFCERSILCGGGVHEEPPEDVYQQILQLLNTTLQRTPKVSSHGTWMLYNEATGAYEDTGESIGTYGDWDARYFEPGYIKNRPFGVDHILEPVLAEVQCTPTGTANRFTIPLDFTIELGKTYRVVYNGAVYRAIAESFDVGGSSRILLHKIVPDDSDPVIDSPFFIYQPIEGENGYVHAYDGATSVRLQIDLETGEIAKKLDGKHLPDDIADWNAAEGQPGHILNRTHYVLTYGDLETVVPVMEATPTQHPVRFDIPVDFKLELERKYRVIYNGQHYDLDSSYVTSEDGEVVPVLGSLSLSKGWPFFIFPPWSGETGRVMANDGATSATIGIYVVSEKIKKLDRKFLPDDLGGVKTVNGQEPDESGNVQVEAGGVKTVNGQEPDESGNVQVETSSQSDWNAAEGGSGHVLNRTHWVEVGMVEVLPEWTFKSYAGNGKTLKTPLGLTPGKTYIVNWDGTEYKCVAFTAEIASEGGTTFTATFIGDYSKNMQTVPATGEPFGIMEFDQSELIEIFGYAVAIRPNDDTTREYTASVTEVNETIHKLPTKFLPDGYPYVENNGVLLEESEATAYTNPTFGKVWEILQAPTLEVGKTYTIVYNGTPFNCVCQLDPSGSSDDPNAMAMGNFSIAGYPDTGEPFVMLISNLYNRVDIIDLVGSSSVKVEILGEIVHKIDSKFLPSSGIYTVVFNSDADFNITTNCSYAEAFAKALDTNTVVRGVLQIVGYNGVILGNFILEFVTVGDNYLEFRRIQLDENNFILHTINFMEDGTCAYEEWDMLSRLRG